MLQNNIAEQKFLSTFLSVAKLAKARDCNGFVILRSGVRLTPGRRFFLLRVFIHILKRLIVLLKSLVLLSQVQFRIRM